MEPVERAAEDEGVRTKYKECPTESKLEPADPPRLPSPLPPPQLYIPEKLLPRALSALQDEDLAQFKRKLCGFRPSLRISRARVEAADVAELRDLLLCNYGWSEALQKADRALEKTRWQRDEWLDSSTQGLWISNWLGYALESLDRDDLERFQRKLSSPLHLRFFFQQELERIDVPYLCRLMLMKWAWSDALRMSAVVLEDINRKDEAGWLRVAEKRSHGPQIFLQHALQTLEKEDLQRFKKHLLHFCEQRDSDWVVGERRVKIFEDLKPVDAGELTKSLISCYGSFEALEMAADVLETINQKRLAGWLRLCLEAPDPWECLEDTLVRLGKKVLQELKHYFFPSFLFLTVNWTTVEAADVSTLCHLLRGFCGDFVALDVASEILEAIGQKHQADWLRLGMVGFNLQKCLDCVLQHLGQEKRERFKGKLRDHWREMGCGLLPTWEVYRTKTLEFFDLLAQSDVSQLRRKLIEFYGVKDALKVITKVLDAMNEKSEVDWLRMQMEEQDAWRHLEDAFSNLGEEHLERFRCKILHVPENKGLPCVPKTWMKVTTIPQFIKVLFSFYGQSAALEMVVEALKTIADRVSSSTMTDLYQYLVQIYGSAASPLESLVSEEEMSGKMKSPADLGKICDCKRSPSENLPEKKRPEVVWHPESNQEMYKFCSTTAGSFHCCYTELIFEVRGAATIIYQFGSWKKHLSAKDAQNLMIAGPLLNIQADPVEAVAAIHFPHFLCLADEDKSHLYVAHFLDEGMSLERPDRVGPFHAVLKDPTFSLFGTILQMLGLNQNIMIDAVVLLYQVLEIAVPKFHLYLLPRDSHLMMTVDKHEEKCLSRRLQKPPRVSRPLKIGSRFLMVNIDGVTVCPEDLQLEKVDAEIEQQYLELYAPRMEGQLEVNMVEKESNESVWKTYVRCEELILPSSHPAQELRLPVPSELHFIQRHRAELIQRTASVEVILDMLVNNVIDGENYENISSRKTSQEKMRELYKLVPSWNDSCKDLFYSALKKTNRFLIAELEESER